MSVDGASAIPSRLKRSRVSSLRYASVVMAILPVTLGCLLAMGTLFWGPSAEAVAGVAAILFGINALIMPRLLDWRIGARLTALIDTLRAARDGQFERVPHMNDNDAIGDIARLAYDLVAMQANSGRFALGLHRAKEFAQASDDMIDRLADGAQEVDRMLAVFEASTKTLSRVSERFVGNLNAVTTGADRNVQDLVDAASRAVRSAEALVSAAGKGGAPIGHPVAVETHGGRTLAQAIDPIVGKLEDLGQAIAGLPKAAELRRICAGASAPVLEKLSELPGQTKASLASLEAPIVEARRALEAKLDNMDGRIANSRRDVDAATVKTLAEITLLSDAVARVEARVSGAPAKAAPPAPAVDISPVMERLAQLERPLALLLERPAAHVETVDIEPLKAGLAEIAARLASIGADAAKAARNLPSVDMAPVMASVARLERPLALLVERPPAVPETVDLQPVMTGLSDLALRLSRMEAQALRLARNTPSIDHAPILEGIARLERPLASLAERAPSEPVNIQPVLAGLADVAARLAAMEAQALQRTEVAPIATPAVDLTPILDSIARLERPLAELTERPLASSEPVDLQPVLAGIADLAARLAMVGDAAEAAIAAATEVPAVDMAPVLDGIARLERPLAALAEQAPSEPVDMQPVVTGLADLAARLAAIEAQAAQGAAVVATAAAAVDTAPILEAMARLERPLAELTGRPLAAAGPVDLQPVLAGIADLAARLAMVGDAAEAAIAATTEAPLVDMTPVLENIARLEGHLALLTGRSTEPSEPVDLNPVMAGLNDLAAKLASTEAHAAHAAKLSAIAAAAVDMTPILQSMDRLQRPLALLTEQPLAATQPVDLGPVMQGLADLTARLAVVGADAAEAARAAAPTVDMAPVIESMARLEAPLTVLTERSMAPSEPVDLQPVLAGLAELASALATTEAHAAHAARLSAAAAGAVDMTPILQSMDRLERPLALLAERPLASPERVDLGPVMRVLADLTARLSSIGADAAQAAQAAANAAPVVDVGPIIEGIARLERPLAQLIERPQPAEPVDLGPVLQGLAEVTTRLSGIASDAAQAASAAAVTAPVVDIGPVIESIARLERPLAQLIERPQPAEPVDLGPVLQGLAEVTTRLSGIASDAARAASAAAVTAPVVDIGPVIEGIARLERPLAQLIERPQAAEPVDLGQVLQGLAEVTTRLSGIASDAAQAAHAAPVVDIGPVIESIARLEHPLAQLIERLPAAEPVDLNPVLQGLAGLTATLATIGADAAQAAHAAPIDIEPIRESIARLERPLALLIERSLVAPDAVDLQPVLHGLAELASRLSTTEQHAQEAAKAAAAVAPPLDPGPMVESLTRLEQSLARLADPSTAATAVVDLDPVSSALNDIASRLAAIEARASSAPVVSHPDAGLVAEFDAARAPLQRLLVTFRLALRDIVQESDRLRVAVDGLARPDDQQAASLDLSPIVARLDDVVSRLDSVEALTQESLRSRPVGSDPGQLAEFDAAKAPMQRILVGLRLALREISEDAARFREAVQQIGAQPAPEASGVATPVIDLSPIAEQLDDIINRLSSLEVATQEAVRSRPVPPDASLLAEFDAAKAPMQRILTGLRLALREISDSAADFRETVKQIGAPPAAEASPAAMPPPDLSPIAERLDELAQRFSAIEAALHEAGRTPPAPAPAASAVEVLPQLVMDRSAMSTALTGLKLMMREIGNEATALREAADALPGKVEITVPAVDMSPVAERLDDLARRFSSIEAALQEPARAPSSAATTIENQLLPQLVIDRSAMSTALTGLKLMMREISTEATALRAAADNLPARLEVTAPALDLSAIAEPLAALREELAAGHGVLAEIHAQIGRDRLLSKPLPLTMAESGTPSLTTTLSLMSAFSSAVEIRFNDIEERIADVAQNYQSDDGRGAGDELATRLLEAASEMRKEVDQFLAVGAALSEEIEAAAKDRKVHARDAHESRSAMRLS